MLEDFATAVDARMKRYGFDWSTLIVTFLPVVVEMITNCFNKSSDLQAFAEGKRDRLRMAGLRKRCREVVQEEGVRGPLRIAAAAAKLEAAILEELDERAAIAGGTTTDLYDQAFAEACSVS